MDWEAFNLQFQEKYFLKQLSKGMSPLIWNILIDSPKYFRPANKSIKIKAGWVVRENLGVWHGPWLSLYSSYQLIQRFCNLEISNKDKTTALKASVGE